MSEPNENPDVITFPMDDETRANVAARLEAGRHANSVLITQINQMTGQNPEYAPAMIIGMFEAMVELGMIERDTWLAMQLMWEERFHENLRKFTAEVQRTIEEQMRRQTLLAPQNGGRLIVPPGQQRRVRDDPQA